MEVIAVPIIIGVGLFAVVYASAQAEKEEKELAKWMTELIHSMGGEMVQEEKSGWWTVFAHQGGVPIEGREELLLKIYKQKEGKHYNWYYEVGCSCQNLKEITLQIYPEGMMSGLGKMMGMQDIEIFNDNFDNRFIIKCSHKLFPIQNFSDDFCRRFSRLYASNTKEFSLKTDIVFFRFEGKPEPNADGTRYVKNMMDFCQEIAQMVDNYEGH